MTVELLNPDGLFKPDSYHQVAIGTGSRIVKRLPSWPEGGDSAVRLHRVRYHVL
jgi:hypothetical protein